MTADAARAGAAAQRPAGAAAWPLDVPFDQYQRYRIAAEIAEEVAAAGTPATGHLPRALDVGGHYEGSGGVHRRPIRDFLPHWTTTTVDLGLYPLSGYAEARGSALPFGDGRFDVVTCLDVLEHVLPAERSSVLLELARVARRTVVVAAPFLDARVVRAEHLLADFIRRTWGTEQAQLAEHRERGWPPLDEAAAELTRAGWAVDVFAHGNLWRWLFMMIDKHAVSALPHAQRMHEQLDVRYNEVDFDRDAAPPCYRHFIVAWRDGADAAREAVEQRFVAPSRQRSAAPSLTLTPADEAFLELAGLHARNQALVVELEAARRDAQLAASEDHRVELYRHIDAKDRYIRKLEALFKDVEQSPIYRVARTLRGLLPGAPKALTRPRND